jgi:hypothetical protein
MENAVASGMLTEIYGLAAAQKFDEPMVAKA